MWIQTLILSPSLGTRCLEALLTFKTLGFLQGEFLWTQLHQKPIRSFESWPLVPNITHACLPNIPPSLAHALCSHIPTPSSLAMIPAHGSHEELRFPACKSGRTDQPCGRLRLLLKYPQSESIESLIYTEKKIDFALHINFPFNLAYICKWKTVFLAIACDFTFSRFLCLRRRKGSLNHCRLNFLMSAPLVDHFHPIYFSFYFHHHLLHR